MNGATRAPDAPFAGAGLVNGRSRNIFNGLLRVPVKEKILFNGQILNDKSLFVFKGLKDHARVQAKGARLLILGGINGFLGYMRREIIPAPVR